MSQGVQYTDTDPPSPFIAEWAGRLATRLDSPRRALDIAMGRGRHATLLALKGFNVFGVDFNLDAVREAQARTERQGATIHGWCADLTMSPLPRARFELVVVARYLQRDLFQAVRDALVPGGAIVYETFTIHQRGLGRGPTSSDHLLLPGELGARFEGFEVLLDEEVSAPDALARFVGVKPPA